MKAPIIVSVLACATSWILGLAAMSAAPAEMPIHWNLAGEPDAYTSGKSALLLIPIVQMHLALIMLVIARCAAPPAARRPAAWVACATVISLTWVQLTFALRAWGYELPRDMDATVALAIPFLAIGYLLPQVPPNPVLGIRVSRTLEDERVWYATHRAARRWFLAGGLGLLTTAALPIPFWVSVLAFVGGPIVASLAIAYTIQPDE